MNQPDLEKQKVSSLSHQLIKAGRFINERGLAAAREAFNLPELKQTHLDLFPHIDFEGTSISEIAKRKGVSKQAASKLVQEMVRMKILYLKADPDDSRSKRVYFKTNGPFAIQKGFEAFASIDQLLAEYLGEKSYRAVLKKVTESLEVLAGS